MSPDGIGAVILAGMVGMILLRMPVALAMAAGGFVGFAWVVAVGPAVAILESGPVETLSSYAFSPIPMFILMGVLASKARLSADLFAGTRALCGGWRGGMALAAVGSCGVFAAISGSSVATAASMARVALPEMKARGYADSLATGALAAGGTLGIMIPPSVALLLYALITEQSVGALFVAGVLPGLLGLALYGLAVAGVVALRPDLAEAGAPTSRREKLAGLRGVLPFAGLFATIVGGLYGGLFTPSEAGAMGACATAVVARRRGMTWREAWAAVEEAVALSAMIFFMLIGAEILGTFLSVSRLSDGLADALAAAGLGPYGVLIAVLALFLVLGCVMDSMAMLLLAVPVVLPLIQAAGFDLVWFGVVTVITVEMGLITPPVGMNVFVIKSVAPGVPIGAIYRGVLPFVLADVLRLALLIAFPALALGLL